jgi:hypothetical protein
MSRRHYAHKRSFTYSSDSDSDVGRRVDYSDDGEPKPKHKSKQKDKPEKVKEKLEEPAVKTELPQPAQPVQPAQAKPQAQKLTKARRADLISKFKQGVVDPEYEVCQKENNTFRVTKRKTFFTPSASQQTVSPPKTDIPITWMNMQESMNQSLLKEVKHLRKKFEKISDKYEEKKTIGLPYDLQQKLNDKPPPTNTQEPPPTKPSEPNNQRSGLRQSEPKQEQLQPSGKNRQGQYVRAKRLTLHDF